MRHRATALAWIDPEASVEYASEVVQIRRLAKRLGYHLIWPDAHSILSPTDQVRAADVDAVITPSPSHLNALTLHALMGFADVETVWPRLSFARWSIIGR